VNELIHDTEVEECESKYDENCVGMTNCCEVDMAAMARESGIARNELVMSTI
jgi:hypothetical protein